MTDNSEKTLSGTLYGNSSEITIVELRRVCSIDAALVDELIEEGVIEITGGRRDDRRLPYSSVRRTLTVVRMQRDLGVNTAGAALAIELLERIRELRAQLIR